MESYKVSKLFAILWGLVGIWISLVSSVFFLFVANSPFWGFLTFGQLIVIAYLLVSGRATKKTEYSRQELTQRGVVSLVMIGIPGFLAVYWVGSRPYMIPFLAVIVILLVLMILELRKAERIPLEQ